MAYGTRWRSPVPWSSRARHLPSEGGCRCPSPSGCCAARLPRVCHGPASRLTANLCSQPPVLSQRVETQACLARNLAPVMPNGSLPTAPLCFRLASRLGLASLLPGAWVRPARDHRAPGSHVDRRPVLPGHANTSRTPPCPPRRGRDCRMGPAIPCYQQRTP